MSPHPLPPPHYVTKFHALQRRGVIPPHVTLSDIHVFHDAWCGHWGGASCNCDPNLGLKRASEWKLAPGSPWRKYRAQGAGRPGSRP